MGWNRKEQKRGAARFLTPVFRAPPPPSNPAEAVFRARSSRNFNGFNALHSCPINQTAT
jgi:hypothetical protein